MRTRDYKGRIGIARQTCSIIIRNHEGDALFQLYFYGLTITDLASIGEDYSGGDIVAAALKRRGFNPSDFLFMLWDVGP